MDATPLQPPPRRDISARPSGDVGRERVVAVVLTTFSIVAIIVGARMIAFAHGNPEFFLTGFVVALLGVPIPFYVCLSAWRSLRGRYRTGRCPRCGHTAIGLHGVACPKCGGSVL